MMRQPSPDFHHAVCLDYPRLFDGTTIRDITLALQGCQACPILTDCSRWARDQAHRVGGNPGDVTGMRGGAVHLNGVIGGRVYGDAAKLLAHKKGHAA